MLATGGALRGVVGEEVQVELGVWIFDLVDLFHAKELIILDWMSIRFLKRRKETSKGLLDL